MDLAETVKEMESVNDEYGGGQICIHESDPSYSWSVCDLMLVSRHYKIIYLC